MRITDKEGHSLCLQERDFALLRGLLECRVMTLAQITAIHFDGHAEAAKKRVGQLKKIGLISDRRQTPFDRSVLHLNRTALVLLRDTCQLGEFASLGLRQLERRAHVSDRTLRHELDITSVHAALATAVRNCTRIDIREFSTSPRRNQFTVWIRGSETWNGKAVTLKPDAFINLCEQTGGGRYDHRIFLEVDRSTELLSTLAAKAEAYAAYYRSGGFAQRLGGRRSFCKECPFRVLFVCRTQGRSRRSMARIAICEPNIRMQLVWTTMQDITCDPLGESGVLIKLDVGDT